MRLFDTKNWESLTGDIPADRRQILNYLAGQIEAQNLKEKCASIVFICTHNSRRSQICEAWLNYLAVFLKLPIRAYSAGTEATELHPKMLAAMQKYQFDIAPRNDNNSIEYIFRITNSFSKIMYSKTYRDASLPQKDLIAVMVCDQASESCPFIPGTLVRIALPYEDPRHFDNSPQEQEAYFRCIEQAGKEMIYLVQNLTNKKAPL